MLGVSASGPTKRWDIENYIKLASKLSEYKNCKFFIAAGKNDLEIMDIKDIVTLVCEEDFYKFYQYIIEIKKLEHSIRGKYSF